MSKKSNRNGNFNYNRPSGGYQKNLYRQKLNAEGIKAPKAINEKTFRIFVIVVAAVWLALSIFLTIKLSWKGLLIGLAVGLVTVGGIYLYLRNKQTEVIKYYKKIGLTETMYINELKKRGTPQKQLDAYRKTWRKTKVD
ncbi:MAG: hypothetical protein IJH43_05200 [Mogibacterium sp.]|nr:hypothetical protein [Mogibacterium sp.]